MSITNINLDTEVVYFKINCEIEIYNSERDKFTMIHENICIPKEWIECKDKEGELTDRLTYLFMTYTITQNSECYAKLKQMLNYFAKDTNDLNSDVYNDIIKIGHFGEPTEEALKKYPETKYMYNASVACRSTPLADNNLNPDPVHRMWDFTMFLQELKG